MRAFFTGLLIFANFSFAMNTEDIDEPENFSKIAHAKKRERDAKKDRKCFHYHEPLFEDRSDDEESDDEQDSDEKRGEPNWDYFSTIKPNGWQADSGEVLKDKRVEDGHKNFRYSGQDVQKKTRPWNSKKLKPKRERRGEKIINNVVELNVCAIPRNIF